MVLYRRARVAGASYFFTLALADRRQDLLTRHVDLLRECFRQAQLRRPFHIDAVVILPEHLHLVMNLPADDQDYAARIGQLKVLFTRGLRAGGVAIAANTRREAGIWQPRYWEHVLRDERDFAAHVDYIHINPLKHGLVQRVVDWPWSSFHHYVRDGLLTADWAGGDEERASDGW